ncbi:hypothetical protein E2C01_101883 [Portunus trituberculatus]|uniref:Uncharacterized protein n=1 Tax=Portunus trituberculatus TaxID=210409 RepID=A0A5B7KH49_PORTR|nr:hypothetical protein [Portunus trituberculatus]
MYRWASTGAPCGMFLKGEASRYSHAHSPSPPATPSTPVPPPTRPRSPMTPR